MKKCALVYSDSERYPLPPMSHHSVHRVVADTNVHCMHASHSYVNLALFDLNGGAGPRMTLQPQQISIVALLDVWYLPLVSSAQVLTSAFRLCGFRA